MTDTLTLDRRSLSFLISTGGYDIADCCDLLNLMPGYVFRAGETVIYHEDQPAVRPCQESDFLGPHAGVGHILYAADTRSASSIDEVKALVLIRNATVWDDRVPFPDLTFEPSPGYVSPVRPENVINSYSINPLTYRYTRAPAPQ